MVNVKKDSGQIALMLVLIMTVVGAAAISLAGRSVVETRVQEVNVDSSQAMLAAEAGLERALGATPVYSGSVGSEASFDVTRTDLGTNYAILGPFKSGEIWEINLIGATGTAVNLFWESSTGDGSSRGLYVSTVAIPVSPALPSITDYAIAPAGFGVGFDASGITTNQTLGGQVFDYRRSVSFTAGTSSTMRVMFLGGDTTMGFQAGGTLAIQVKELKSVGTVTRGDEAIKQGLGYYESVTDQIPVVFQHALYTDGQIVHN